MSNNYQINLNPKEPDKEQIAKYQDFDALLAKFQATQVPTRTVKVRRLAFAASAFAAAVTGLIFFIFLNQSPQQTPDEYFAQQEYVNPPLENFTPQFTSQKVNVNQGGVFEFETGSRMVVPVAAFADDYGNPVQGEVDIHFREMHDFIDFFLAGMPMIYDSAGVRYHLESAGMVEIYAEQNGQRVHLVSGKNIEVELVSEINVPNLNVPPRYNIYKLDSAARNWVYQDIDRIQMLEDEVLDANDPLYPMKKDLFDEIAQIENRAKAEIKLIESSIIKPVEPLRPIEKYGNNPTLELDFQDQNITFETETLEEQLKEESLALQKLYTGTIWQVSPNNPSYDQNAFKVEWEGIQLKQLNYRDYELTLIHGENRLNLVVNPVLIGDDYQKAMELYETQYAEYQNAIEFWENQLEEQKNKVQAQMETEKAEAQVAFNERLNTLRDQGLEYLATQEIMKRRIINRFNVTSLGIWNCDRPIAPEDHQINARFKDKSGKDYINRIGFLVDKSRNSVHQFLATKDTKLHFNPDSENLLWIITEDNKIAVFSPDDFKKINRKKGNFTFELTVMDQELNSEEEVRKILEF